MSAKATGLLYQTSPNATTTGKTKAMRGTSKGVAYVEHSGGLEEANVVKAGRSSATAASNTICNFAVTTSSVAFDLSGAAYAGLAAAIAANRYLSLWADGTKVYYRFATATGTVDQTKTLADTPLNQAEGLADGERRDVVAGTDAAWLMLKGTAAGYLRITVSSAAPTT